MKVSVVIPIYNVEPYVKECIASVMEQTLSDIEIICINDMGSDNSFAIVKELAETDSRIRLFENEKNIGLAATRNRGISYAKGKYIYFLDSDDKIKKNALELLAQKADEEMLDAVIFCADFIYENETLKKKFQNNPSHFKQDYPLVMSGKKLYMEWMKCWDWMPSQPRYFYNREFLISNNIAFMEGVLHEDESFAFDVLMHAEAVRVLKDEFFIRRFRANSIMTSLPTMKNVEGCIKILEHITSCKDIYENDFLLSRAVKFYMYKILKDAAGKCQRIIGPSKPELYCCSSYYQVFVSLIKAFAMEQEIDLVLEEHGIETAKELAKLMTGIENVRRVFVCPDNEYIDPYSMRLSSFIPKQKKQIVKHMEQIFDGFMAFDEYENINVFWDLGYAGTYFNIKKIHYTLHEDSLNSYKFIRANRKNYAYIFAPNQLKFFIKKTFGVGVVPFGFSKCCDTVEVNEIDGIEIPKDKVREVPRAALEQRLSSTQKKLIFDVLSHGLTYDRSDTGKRVLLLTEPFAVTGRLPDEERQVKMYRDIIDSHASGNEIIIKPHPRDNTDYSKYFPNAILMEKNVPTEVLNFDEGFCFLKAITVTSSAIYGIRNVEEKIYLGAEFLKDYNQ